MLHFLLHVEIFVGFPENVVILSHHQSPDYLLQRHQHPALVLFHSYYLLLLHYYLVLPRRKHLLRYQWRT